MNAADVADCTHRPTCPGCPRFGLPGIGAEARLELERIAQLAEIAVEPVTDGDALGSRHRARLMVRGRHASPKVGLFQLGSHRIADIPTCGIHHPLINAVAGVLKNAIRSTRSEPYADAPHRGLVRAVQVVVERESQSAQVVVVANADTPESALPLFDAVGAELGERLHSLWWNGNFERTNRVLGPHWQHIRGPQWVREHIGAADVFFPPGAFGQSNLPVADRIVDELHDCVDPNASVAEFYAGCGALGLGLLGRGQQVTFNEISPYGITGLEIGLAALPSSARTRARLLRGPAGEHAALAREADVVIADPPRKGLDSALCEALSASPPERLLYLSCDASSLGTDTQRLLEGGRLKLKRLAPYALFPFTEHVETLAIFDRR